ncbi:MAG: energy transducer TonB [Flavobacteriaceae bacterium]
MKTLFTFIFVLNSIVLFSQSTDSLKVINFNDVEIFPHFKKTKCKLKLKREKLKKCIQKEFYKVISKKFNHRIPASLGLKANVYKILTEFIIDENGKVINIKSSGDVKEVAEEMKRIVKSFPKIIPGFNNGKTVPVAYKIPSSFKVE